jgi:hypothetical protein
VPYPGVFVPYVIDVGPTAPVAPIFENEHGDGSVYSGDEYENPTPLIKLYEYF